MRRVAGIACLLACLFLPLTVPEASAGTIAGKVFTAESPDSVAKGVSVTLVFHGGPGSDMTRVEAMTDAEGHFHFLNLSSDTSLAYVLQIRYRGTDFLSNPIRFPPGEDQVDYNVLLTNEPPAGETSQPMVQGRPAPQSPVQTVTIVLLVVGLFALFAVLARRREDAAQARELPPEARSLIREIASLDVRHEEGIIADEEYRKVRSALMARLRSLTPGRVGSAG